MVSAKPWQIESTLKLVLRLVFGFAVGGVLASIARAAFGQKVVEDSMLHLVIVALTLQVAGLVLIAIFIREHGVGWAQAFGFRNGWRRALLTGLAASAVILPLIWILQALAGTALQAMGFDMQEQAAVQLLRGADTFGKRLIVGVVAILLAPPVEEMFFRGILYPFIKQCGFPRWALWGTALLFAFVHGNFAILIPLVALAVMLALLYEWTDNLLTAIIVHVVFNAANFLLLCLTSDLFRIHERI